MIHARSLGRRSGMIAVAPVLTALAVAATPTALAAGTDDGTTATATFDSVSCSGRSHTIDLSVKNPSPSSATFTIHVSGPHVAVPNSITVPASGSNGVKVTLPDDATSASVSDSTGNVIGNTSIKCSGSTSSTDPTASSGASSGASAAPSGNSSQSVAAPAPATTSSTSSSSNSGTRKMIGYGLAGLGVLIAIGLLIREFK